MLPNAFKSQNILNAASCECPLFAMRSQYILDDIVLKIETFFLKVLKPGMLCGPLRVIRNANA